MKLETLCMYLNASPSACNAFLQIDILLIIPLVHHLKTDINFFPKNPPLHLVPHLPSPSGKRGWHWKSKTCHSKLLFHLCTKVVVKDLVPSDYQLGPSYTKEFSLVGKDEKKEKLQVMEKPSLFNKNFKVVSENIVWLWKSKCTSKLYSYLGTRSDTKFPVFL